MKKPLLFILLAVAAGIIYMAGDILKASGAFKTIHPHFDGAIEKINLPVAGPEDITTDQETGLAFISCDDRRTNFENPGKVEGAILLMDLSDSSGTVKNITPPGLTDFHPHGISLYKVNDSLKILFAISHRNSNPRHVIERFEWRSDSLKHIETISDPQLVTAPNDLTATGERSFYVTNDHYYAEQGVGRILEEYLQRAISYVNYFDGNSFKKVADGIAYANGIQISKDGKSVYVASVTGGKVLIYDRLQDNSLKLRSELKTATGVDNIEFDENGDLLIGCHPQLLKFVAHGSNPANFSPAQVIRVNPETLQVEEVFLNDGSEYSGSTVAARYGKKILVGSVFEPSLLILKLK